MKPTKTESKTVIKERGSYERTYVREGKKYRQKTKRYKKNPERVLLAKHGDMELYCYPFQYPDTVFLGIYPYSIQLNQSDLTMFFNFHNKAKWFLNEEAFRKPKRRKGANARRRAIVRAYGEGLNKLKKAGKR